MRGDAGGAEDTGRSSQALVGAPVDTANTFSVGVCGGEPNTDPDAGPVGACLVRGLRCTGTLVAPNLVLTARHCVDTGPGPDCTMNFDAKPTPAEKLFVTLDASVITPPVAWRDVAEVLLPPGANACSDDLALLVLKEAIPAADAKPVDVAVDWNVAVKKPAKGVAMVSRGVVAYGFYGRRPAGPTSAGSRAGSPRTSRSRARATRTSAARSRTSSPRRTTSSSSKGLMLVASGIPVPGDSGRAYLDQESFAQGSPPCSACTPSARSTRPG